MSEVFDEIFLVMFISGAMGGLAFVLGTNARWWSAPRRMLLGGVLAAGVGVWAPLIITNMLGIEVTPDGNAPRFLAGAAFVVGFVQDVLVEYMLRKRQEKDSE